MMPVLSAVLFSAACEGDPTPPAPSGSVRFFNATTGMAGSGAFTANGQFTTGSAVGFGEFTQTCSAVTAGTTSFGFGAANSAGTDLSGAALATLNNQAVTDGGNYTMVVTGSAASPQMYLLDNSFTSPLPSGQAAVRFVNLAPGPNPVPHVFAVFTAWPPVQGALFANNVLVGTPTAFKNVPSGTTSFSVIIGHQTETLNTTPITLQSGSVNTIAIAPTSSGGLQLINIPRC